MSQNVVIGDLSMVKETWIRIFCRLADELNIQKEQKVLADSGDKDAGDILFKVIVMQKAVS